MNFHLQHIPYAVTYAYSRYIVLSSVLFPERLTGKYRAIVRMHNIEQWLLSYRGANDRYADTNLS